MKSIAGFAALASVVGALSIACAAPTEEPEDVATSAGALKSFACQYRGEGCDKAACAQTGDAVNTGFCPSAHNGGWGCKVGNTTYCERVHFGLGSVNQDPNGIFDEPPPSRGSFVLQPQPPPNRGLPSGLTPSPVRCPTCTF